MAPAVNAPDGRPIPEGWPPLDSDARAQQLSNSRGGATTAPDLELASPAPSAGSTGSSRGVLRLRLAFNLVPLLGIVILFAGIVTSCGWSGAPGFDHAPSGRRKLYAGVAVVAIASASALLLTSMGALRAFVVASLGLLVATQPMLGAASTFDGARELEYACEYTAVHVAGVGIAGYASNARAMGFLAVCLAPVILALLVSDNNEQQQEKYVEQQQQNKVDATALGAGNTPSQESETASKSKKVTLESAAAEELRKAANAAQHELEEGLRRARGHLEQGTTDDAGGSSSPGADAARRKSAMEPEWLKRAYSSMVEHRHHTDRRRTTMKPPGTKSA